LLLTHNFFGPLAHFAVQPTEIRQTFMKERIRCAINHKLVARKRRNSMKGCIHYRISAEVDFPVCVNTFKNVYGIFSRQWEYLLSQSSGEYECGAIQHGNTGNRSRHLTSNTAKVQDDVIAFLEELRDERGEAQ
jgi:hypothetical protein